MMNKDQLRNLALEIFKTTDTDDLVSIIMSTDKSKFSVAEMDNFMRFVSEQPSREEYKDDFDYDYEPEAQRQPSNLSQSLKKMQEIDIFKSPQKQVVTVVKQKEPFLFTSASDCSDMPTSDKPKTGESSELFAALFSGPGSLGVKSPKLPKQENEFPLGLKAFDTQLEPQENHSDEDAFT
jgi:hypothetical protein